MEDAQPVDVNGTLPPPWPLPSPLHTTDLAPQHYSNIHGAIYGFSAVSLTITTLTTGLRLYTKFCIFKVRRWDDYLMIASWCGLVCMWAFILRSVSFGAGDHLSDVLPSDITGFQKFAFVHELFYAIVQCLLKTSIALQILHVFVPNLSIRSNRTPKFWIIFVFTALQDAWFFTFFWVSLFQCDPVEKEFNYLIPGHCIAGWNEYNIVVSVWNMTSDILMLLFPMFCIWKVQMKFRFKVEAASVFFLGALAVASSCLRLVFSIRRLHTNDLTLVLTQVALCDTGEITAGILCGNAVPLPRLIFEITRKVKALIHPDLYGRPKAYQSHTQSGVPHSMRATSAPVYFDPARHRPSYGCGAGHEYDNYECDDQCDPSSPRTWPGRSLPSPRLGGGPRGANQERDRRVPPTRMTPLRNLSDAHTSRGWSFEELVSASSLAPTNAVPAAARNNT